MQAPVWRRVSIPSPQERRLRSIVYDNFLDRFIEIFINDMIINHGLSNEVSFGIITIKTYTNREPIRKHVIQRNQIAKSNSHNIKSHLRTQKHLHG